MTKDLISIIIPIYNTERFIKNIILDVLSQTYKNFELILINDGSSDQSGQICDNFAKKDNRIKVIHKKNSGVSAARNEGIELSKGNYICFLDADDRIPNNYIEELYLVSVDNDCLISACPIIAVNESNQIFSTKQIPHGNYTATQALKELFEFRNLSTGPCAKMFHKSLFDNNLKFPIMKTYEDLIVTYKTIYKAKMLFFTQNTHYTYIHRKGIGAMDSFNNSPTNDVIIAVNEILPFVKNNSKEIFDTSFYGLISQVIMYLPNVIKNDPKIQKNTTKIFVKGTKQILAKHRRDLYRNKTISTKEKILFLIYSYSFISYYIIYKTLKWRDSH